MFVGLDMGGTHTDAVLIEKGRVSRHYKTVTDAADFVGTIRRALEALLAGINLDAVRSINLSTTICTNAVITGRTSPVGLLLEPGPGMNPAVLTCGQKNFILSGSIDHRGRPTSPLVEAEIKNADRELQRAGIRHLAIVGKFSTRNPEHEVAIKEALSVEYDFITLGHRLSGRLNFPRRVFTAYLNSAVAATYRSFAAAITDFVMQKGLTIAPHILKADGGTMTIEASQERPVETILSGPAASIMGALALMPVEQDAVILDIGGTTTDIAFLAGGVPLFEPQGITLTGFPTLVRALFSHSLGLGGDSCVNSKEGRLTIGPERRGPALALGGPTVTPTDALITLGRLDVGDKTLARRGLTKLGDELGLSPESAATVVLRQMAEEIARCCRTLLDKINDRPVYTVREVLEGRQIKPAQVIAIGAPAPLLAPELEKAFALPVIVPDLAGVANAVGAALSRPTTELTLLADTEEGVLTVPEEGIRERIPGSYNLEQAKKRALELLRSRYTRLTREVEEDKLEIIEEQVFNMVSGFYTTGKNIRIKAQVKPRVIPLKGDGDHV
ncbi:hydantoinase/oxoprolinase family protein [Neomoorella humiferrea]|uniref:Acetophenone carboxylase alpha subunit n=1 Tax=Neomoorella humiferrea TaxID=676965 RepID=A0A2T0AUL5_9FIRM|nr:hydantoinase/oxoprolinase family protein [Moorella humiferrea]PRR74206.1 Acetophenone carboxylase alpha subunit [Moorella humiferrea]